MSPRPILSIRTTAAGCRPPKPTHRGRNTHCAVDRRGIITPIPGGGLPQLHPLLYPAGQHAPSGVLTAGPPALDLRCIAPAFSAKTQSSAAAPRIFTGHLRSSGSSQHAQIPNERFHLSDFYPALLITFSSPAPPEKAQLRTGFHGDAVYFRCEDRRTRPSTTSLFVKRNV
jgi:hypothetical protein